MTKIKKLIILGRSVQLAKVELLIQQPEHPSFNI